MPAELTPEQRARAAATRSTKAAERRPFNRVDCAGLLQVLGQACPKVYQGHVEKMGDGSLRAAVTLKCLECCSWHREAVANCGSSGTCPLWPFRPYQRESE